MHQYYHSVGITDLQAITDKAHEKLKKGQEVILHLHPYSEACNGNQGCQHMTPERDGDLIG